MKKLTLKKVARYNNENDITFFMKHNYLDNQGRKFFLNQYELAKNTNPLFPKDLINHLDKINKNPYLVSMMCDLPSKHSWETAGTSLIIGFREEAERKLKQKMQSFKSSWDLKGRPFISDLNCHFISVNRVYDYSEMTRNQVNWEEGNEYFVIHHLYFSTFQHLQLLYRLLE